MQLIPLVTLWPLLTQVQHTVSPSVMFSVFGTKARPCPTVTSHTRGPGVSHGVWRGRGVGVGLAVARDEPINAKIVTKAAMNKSKGKGTTARNRRQTSLLFGFVVTRNSRSNVLSAFLAETAGEFQLFYADRMAAHRRSDRRHDDLCADRFHKHDHASIGGL